MTALLDTVLVPADLSAVKLTAALRRERRLTYLDYDQKIWDFYVDLNGNPVPGRGLAFEPVIWKPDLKPGKVIPYETVREYFLGFDALGNVGAFEAWLRQVADPTGYYATIPPDDQCWRSDVGNGIAVPCSFFGDIDRELRQGWIGSGWYGIWSFVGFRPVRA